MAVTSILTLADKVDVIVEAARKLLLVEAKVAGDVRLCGEVVVTVSFNEGGMTHKHVGIKGTVK